MRNYNAEFLSWLERVKELDPKSHEDLPEELQKEFEKLMFLASIPFLHIYGEDPEALGDLLQVCLTDKEYYGENGEPLKVLMIEEGKTFTSPVNHLVAQPLLYAEDDRGRCFVFLYCDWRGPILGEAAAVFDAIHEVHRQKGVAFDDLPDVYFIYLTDYDLTRQGQQVMRHEPGAETHPGRVEKRRFRPRPAGPQHVQMAHYLLQRRHGVLRLPPPPCGSGSSESEHHPEPAGLRHPVERTSKSLTQRTSPTEKSFF